MDDLINRKALLAELRADPPGFENSVENEKIYKKAFEIAVRCARELNGTPELKEAYQEAAKDNRSLQSFMDFCIEKAVEEVQEHTATDDLYIVE